VDERIARLHNHQRKIDRYQSLLKTSLSPAELRFVERRLSEERFTMAILQFMGPPHTHQLDLGARK
jgi:hypothetical protein